MSDYDYGATDEAYFTAEQAEAIAQQAAAEALSAYQQQPVYDQNEVDDLYSRNQIVTAAATLQSAAEMQTQKMIGEATNEAFAALRQRFGHNWDNDKAAVGAFIERHPTYLSNEALTDAKRFAEDLERAYRHMALDANAAAVEAKRVDDAAFADSILEAHGSSYAAHMAKSDAHARPAYDDRR